MVNEKYAIKGPELALRSNVEQYPCKHGTTFNVIDEQDNELTIVNMNHENFAELVRNDIISFPISIVKLDKHNAFLTDERIPTNWRVEFNANSYEHFYSCNLKS